MAANLSKGYLSPSAVSSTTGDNTIDDRELGQRIRLVANMNPYMAKDPQALVQMAMMPTSTEDLVGHAGQAYAMQTGSNLAKQLQGLTPGTQRSIYDRLSVSQQQAMASMGYQAPPRDEGGFLSDAAHLAAQPLGLISKGAMAVPGMKEAIGGTLEGLSWVGNWPGHLYRAMRLQDQGQQWLGLAGALAGVAAVALAVPTGGGSLMALGALGLGGLAGATAGAAMTAPEDWLRAFNSSWNGERTFSVGAQKHVEQILGDPRAIGAAHDLSAAGIDLISFAKEMAGGRDIDRNSQMRLIANKANSMAAAGTPENEQLQTMMSNLLQEPTFQEAVQTLNNSKISPGRDLGHAMMLDSHPALFNFVSGITDATFTVAVDPTLMLGLGTELYKAKRFTFAAFEGSEAVTSFRQFVHSRSSVMRTYNSIAEAVELGGHGGMQAMRVRSPQLESLYGDLVEFRQSLRDTGKLSRPFDGEHVIDYLASKTNFAPLLEGKGSVKNVTNRGIQLIGVSAPKMAFREFRGEVRAIVTGMSDIATENKALRLARQRGVDFEMLLPPSATDEIGRDGLIAQPWRFNQHNPTGYAIGRAFADKTRQIPILGRSVGKVGDVLTSMTTMALGGRGIHLVGDEAPKEIRALAEYGRFMGMPSYARQAWADAILTADSPAARMNLMHGWLANALHMTGVDTTEEGSRLVDEFLSKSKQIYGNNDDILVNGVKLNAGMFLNDQADVMVMPDLKALRQATTSSYMAKGVFGVMDHPVLETAMNKVWKPAVLLRIGFIPRAAGEELASFMLRSGIGSLTQEAGARYIGRRIALEEALAKRSLAESEGYVGKFTKAEQELLDRGWVGALPAHIRPVVRMLQRVGFEDPALRKFDDYGAWLAERLAKGMGKDPEQLIAHFAGQPLNQTRYASTDVNAMIARLGKRGAANEAMRLGLTPLQAPALMKLNVADYANSIFLGNPYSIRRMMFGGVHNDMIEAGTEWARTHSTTVMREASAITNGPIDPGYDSSSVHKEWQTDPVTGDLHPVSMMVDKGQRVVYAHGDRYHQGAVLENVTRSLEDPVIGRAAIEHLSRVRSPGVDQERLGQAADAMFAMGRNGDETVGAAGHEARQIVAELLSGKFSREHWNQMAINLVKNPETAPVGRALQHYLPDMKDVKVNDVVQALHQAGKDLVKDDFASNAQYLQARQRLARTRFALEKHAMPTEQWLNGLDVADRRMAAQFLYGQIRGGKESFWAKRTEQLRDAPLLPGPKLGQVGDPLDDTIWNTGGRRVPHDFAGVPDQNDQETLNQFLELRDQNASRVGIDPNHGWDDGVDEHSVSAGARTVASTLDVLKRHPDLTAADKKVISDTEKLIQSGHFSIVEPQTFADITAQTRATNLRDAGVDDTHLLQVRNRESIQLFDDLGDIVDRIAPVSRGAGVAAKPGPWLYDSLDEAMPHMVKDSANMVLDPNFHDKHVTNSLRGAQYDDKGQFVDTHLRSATVNLYTGPDLSGMNYQDILDHASDRALIDANKPVVEAAIAQANRDRQQIDAGVTGARQQTPLMANYALASELHLAAGRAAGLDDSVKALPHMIRRDREVVDGRIHGVLFPDVATKRGEETQLWHMPKLLADKRQMPVPDALLNPVDEWATQMNMRLQDVVRRGNKQVRHAKGRVGEPLPDGTPTTLPVLYRYDNGPLEPIQPGAEVSMDHVNQLHDINGKPVGYGDPMYFEDPPHPDISGEGSDAMWEILGPAMQDTYDKVHGGTLFRRKQASANPTAGDWYVPEQTNDVVPLARSSVHDVSEVPGHDLPTNAVGEVYKNKPVGDWDKMIQFGFDRVIGPSIDAIVRKPMAFHAFATRYIQAKSTLDWTLDPVITNKIQDLVRNYNLAYANNSAVAPDHLARMARSLATYHGDAQAAKWTTNDAMAWLRGHSFGDLHDMITKTITQTAGKTDKVSKLANVHAIQLSRQDLGEVKAALGAGTDMPSFLKSVQSKLPENALTSARGLQTARARDIIAKDDLLRWIDENNHWDLVKAAKTNYDYMVKQAGENAATAAIGDVVPFLDSHEFKTQFADYGKGMLPFWYAEENFLKRWGRGLADEGFPLIRKAQLTYMGMRSAGVVRQDQQGRDWFVYPGSGLLVDAIQRIPGMAAMQSVGVMFESPTDQMLPGINNRFGTPSFSPLVTIPMELVMKIAPELQPVERAILGDFPSGQGITDMIIPAHFRNLYNAIATGEEGNPRFASAMTTAMSYLEAHGDGLPDNATPGEVDHYMDRIRNHARIVVIAQALGGFFTPGSPSEIAAGQSASVTGVGVKNPSEYLNTEYVQLVQSMGIEAGTQKFLELNKDATVDDVVSPLAYTVPKNETISGAPIPSTQGALNFYDKNANYFGEFPNAGPWLLPQVYNQQDRSQYAFDQQTTDGLRKRRTPDEFFRAMKFKIASTEYFGTRDAFQTKIDAAREAGDKTTVRSLTAQRDTTLQVYRMAHPIFTEELQSSDGRVQRTRTLQEMRTVVDDPQHPDTPHFAALRNAMHSFDSYKTRLAVLSNDRSTRAQQETEHLKSQFSQYMSQLVDNNPAIMGFWISVLRPESSLD